MGQSAAGARRAARLLGAAEALRTTLGAPLPPVGRPAYEAVVQQARLALGQTTFATARAAGWALPLERAIAEALGAPPAPPTNLPWTPTSLSPAR